MFELLTESRSTPRGELVTYASRSATRCSSDGAADGEDVSANSGDTDAMTPVSNKIRSITHVCYTHVSFWRQEKWCRELQASLKCLDLDTGIPLRTADTTTEKAKVSASVRTILIGESSRWETIEMKPAATHRWCFHRHRRPHRRRRRYRHRPSCLYCLPG